jgi:transposase InsO family protein
MSRKAISQDNAAYEGFFGHLKTRFFYPRDWRAFTAAQLIDEVDAYIRWYNETRIKMSFGSRSPIEYRKNLGLTPCKQSKFLSAPPGSPGWKSTYSA